MGQGRGDYLSTRALYTSTMADYKNTTNVYDVFKQKEITIALDPKNINLRESCDSDEHNPNSNAIIIGLDVTGSMGRYAHMMAKEGLGKLIDLIYEQQPVVDPHIMFMAIGDIKTDRAPLQVSQFEADIRVIEQLTQIYVEGNGGGNSTESYDLPWYFAANHTKIDCFDKRGKKGYLFTMGDEGWPTGVTASQIEQLMGRNPQQDFTADQLLEAAQEQYNVFHLVVEQGSYCRYHNANNVISQWREHMGKRVLPLSNADYMPEVIITAMMINEGMDVDEAISSWENPDIIATVKHSLGTD